MLKPRRPAPWVALLLLTCAQPEQQRSTPPDPLTTPHQLLSAAALEALADAYGSGVDALRSEDFAAASRHFEQALELSPGDELTMHLLARSQARAGELQGARATLNGLKERNSDLVPEASDLGPWGASEEYTRLRTEMTRTARQTDVSQLLASVDEPNLFPEGIAHDPATGAFFLGSLAQGKVVRVSMDGGQVRARNLVRSGQDSVTTVLGMKIGPDGALWALAESKPTGEENKEGQKVQGLYRWDPAEGTLLDKYELSDGSPHLLNDLTFVDDGTVYVTDTVSGALYRLAPGEEALEIFRPAGSYPGANGIDRSPDGTTLYVASSGKGLAYIGLADGQSGVLPHPAGVPVRGIDGLYATGSSLLAVQNGVGPGRVVRYSLDESGRRILSFEILEANHPQFRVPTTGAIIGDRLVYIATSYLDALGPDNQPVPNATLGPTVLLSLPIH